MLIQPDRYDTAMSVPRNAMVIHQSSRQGFPPTWGCDPEVIEADNDLPMIFFLDRHLWNFPDFVAREEAVRKCAYLYACVIIRIYM
jgi:hypothetical protein